MLARLDEEAAAADAESVRATLTAALEEKHLECAKWKAAATLVAGQLQQTELQYKALLEEVRPPSLIGQAFPASVNLGLGHKGRARCETGLGRPL